MTIPFTQYLMPNGRKVQDSIERPPEVEEKSRAVIEAGGAFEMEMLRVPTGLPNVSITCSYDEEDIAHRLCVNGPDVLDTVDKVVDDAHRFIVLGERTEEEL